MMSMVSSSGRANKKEHAPRMIVALPRAVPIPLPLIAFGPTRLNLKYWRSDEQGDKLQGSGATYIGAFCSMSGTMKNLTILPLM